MAVFKDDDVYVVNPSAQLRNDGKYVIAAFPGSVAVTTLRLTPIEAVVTTLFDGERTCREVVDISSSMCVETSKTPDEDTRKMVDELLSKHGKPQGNSTEPLLIPVSSLSSEARNRIRYYKPTDYIVRTEDWKPNDLHLAFPASLLWLLTNDCQTRCQYCYMQRTEFTREEMLPWERLKELVREAKQNGAWAIFLGGGDPFCHPHFYEFMELLDDLDFQPIDIATKVYITPDAARRLAELRTFRELQFSIDSTVPEVADFMVQSPGFCDRILESIRNAKGAGLEKVSTKTVITPYNVHTIPKLYRDFKAMGIDEIRLATYCKSGYHHSDRLFNHQEDFDWLDRELEKLRKEFPNDNIMYQNGGPAPEPMSQELKEKKWRERSRCTAGRDTMTIAANGRVVACEQMPERDEDYLGNLHVQSLAEVWDGKPMDEYLLHPPRERLKDTPCYDCDEYDECQTVYGVCVRNSCIHYGTRWYPVPECPKNNGPYMRFL